MNRGLENVPSTYTYFCDYYSTSIISRPKKHSTGHNCCKSCILLATPIDHTYNCKQVKVISDYSGIAQALCSYNADAAHGVIHSEEL